MNRKDKIHLSVARKIIGIEFDSRITANKSMADLHKELSDKKTGMTSIVHEVSKNCAESEAERLQEMKLRVFDILERTIGGGTE